MAEKTRRDIYSNTQINHLFAPVIQIYRHGEEVFREGDRLQHFFVILNGRIRISERGKRIRTLEAQDVFGLESIVFKKVSPYTATSRGMSRVAAYSPDSLDYLIRENPRMSRDILVSTLGQLVQTTSNLADELESFTMEDIRVNFYNDGDVIIQEGEPGQNFYRLVSTQGGLKVTIDGKEISTISRPGEFFGEMAGLLKLPRHAAITSVGKSVVEVYGIDDLEIIVHDYPQVALQMMRTMVSRLAELKRKFSGTMSDME